MQLVIANRSLERCGDPFFHGRKIRMPTPVRALARNDRVGGILQQLFFLDKSVLSSYTIFND